MKKQKGLTLIELGITLLISTVVILAGIPFKKKIIEDALAYQTGQRGKLVYENTLHYRRNTGSWPGNTATLVAQGYISATAARTAWGNPINIAVSGSNMQMSFTVPESRLATKVGLNLPAPTITGTTITELISSPGTEASLSALQRLDGTTPWEGDYNAGGFSLGNITNITATGDITSENLIANGDVTAGDDIIAADDITAGGDITASNNVSGNNIIGNNLFGSIFRDGSTYYSDPSSTGNFNQAWFQRLMSTRTPTSWFDIANKAYVDAQSGRPTRRDYACTGRTCGMGRHDMCFLRSVFFQEDRESNISNACHIYSSGSNWFIQATRTGRPFMTTCYGSCLTF